LDIDDFAEPEVAVAVAATAIIASPKVRHALRQGAVYGLAYLLKVGDMVGAFSKGVVHGAREAAASTAEAEKPEEAAAEGGAPKRRKVAGGHE